MIFILMKRMLFDASVLAHGVYHSAARSGIFFTSLNLLYQFRASGQFEIKLYCDPYFFLELQRFLKEEALRGIYFEIFSTESFLARCRANLILKKETALSYKKWFRFLFLKGFLQFVKILYYLFPAKIDSEKFSKELENTDIFFSPVYKIPEEVLKRKNIISAVLLYDLIAIKYPQFQPESRIKNWWLPQLLDCMKDDENTRYYCISEASKRDFLEYLPGFPSERIQVVPLAANHFFSPVKTDHEDENVRRKYHIPLEKEYMFSLCTLDPRKNLIRAINAFSQFIQKHKESNLCFVIGGGSWPKFQKKFNKYLNSRPDLMKHLVIAGYIEDRDLPVLYRNSCFFVYPSLLEGFGLPPLEAMSCGCPVISSRCSSIPEVTGDAALLVDPLSEDEICHAMEFLYFSFDSRQKLSRLGIKQAAKFSWEKTAAFIADDLLKSEIKI